MEDQEKNARFRMKFNEYDLCRENKQTTACTCHCADLYYSKETMYLGPNSTPNCFPFPSYIFVGATQSKIQLGLVDQLLPVPLVMIDLMKGECVNFFGIQSD